jgi:threonine synthase
MKKHPFYGSTNGKVSGVSFRDALLKGLAADGGLFMPDFIPGVSASELENFRYLKYHEIATEIVHKYTDSEIQKEELSQLCADAYNFDVPLEQVSEKELILRLDQGPTASFKDFAARLMSRLMQHFLAEENKNLNILTATSGDTGSAVANAFHGLKNIKVIILYPENEVTLMQRKQMTTLGENISTVAVRGKFDDCQSLVKRAFRDASLNDVSLSSANSINIGRLLPQTVYYFYALVKAGRDRPKNVVFSVPSGNFGNLTAGLFAMKMGLPVRRFIVSTNANDEVPVFLRTGKYVPVVPSRNCISSAMNVGHPSNLSRIIALYGGVMDEKGIITVQPEFEAMKKDIFGVSVSDDETRDTIKRTWHENKVLLEPHGAVAWKGIEEYMRSFRGDDLYILLETAHPAKFPEELERLLKFRPSLPPAMSQLETKNEIFNTIDNNYSDLKKLILNTCI